MAVKWGVDIPTTAKRTPEEWARLLHGQQVPPLELAMLFTQNGNKGWVLSPCFINGECTLIWMYIQNISSIRNYTRGRPHAGWYVYGFEAGD